MNDDSVKYCFRNGNRYLLYGVTNREVFEYAQRYYARTAIIPDAEYVEILNKEITIEWDNYRYNRIWLNPVSPWSRSQFDFISTNAEVPDVDYEKLCALLYFDHFTWLKDEGLLEQIHLLVTPREYLVVLYCKNVAFIEGLLKQYTNLDSTLLQDSIQKLNKGILYYDHVLKRERCYGVYGELEADFEVDDNDTFPVKSKSRMNEEGEIVTEYDTTIGKSNLTIKYVKREGPMVYLNGFDLRSLFDQFNNKDEEYYMLSEYDRTFTNDEEYLKTGILEDVSIIILDKEYGLFGIGDRACRNAVFFAHTGELYEPGEMEGIHELINVKPGGLTIVYCCRGTDQLLNRLAEELKGYESIPAGVTEYFERGTVFLVNEETKDLKKVMKIGTTKNTEQLQKRLREVENDA